MKAGTKLPVVCIGCLAIGVGLLALLVTAVLHTVPSVESMPVFVRVPANPPPSLVAVLGTNMAFHTSVPYARATNKWVTLKDLKQIKCLIPRMKTIGRFYRPRSITVESPTNATAEFWRARTPVWVDLEKTPEGWRVERIHRRAIVDALTPPSLWDKISDKLPF